MVHSIVRELIEPASIVVVGASNNIKKPGGKILKNLRDGSFNGRLYAVNPKETMVQGIQAWADVSDIPQADMAVLAIPSKMCPPVVETLAKKKNTRAFIIVSAGFSEENREGAELENRVVDLIEETGGSLIGPNCIGVMTPVFQAVFTLPIPELSPQGCDFISGSGATAVFIMESGIPKGLKFSSVYSVGNSAQIGVEEMLEFFDASFDAKSSSRTKLLYIESIQNPAKLLKHASSLISKGCRIAAIKAGSSEAGSRAASSHTGAMASSDAAVDALFRKAGIVRCKSREELSTVGGVFMHKEIKGNNIAIITHAGGPAVMLTDALSEGGYQVPAIEGPDAEELLEQLYPGSSVANPIDILATGTAEQLGLCIEYCENRFHHIDAVVIIFGSSGLDEVFDVYELIDQKMKTCKKPIFPVMPSISTAAEEVKQFREKGNILFFDEVLLGQSLVRVRNTPTPAIHEPLSKGEDIHKVRSIMRDCEPGYLDEKTVFALLDAAGIPVIETYKVHSRKELHDIAGSLKFPMVMKVSGPLHKSDIGGVVTGIADQETLDREFTRLMEIKDAIGVVIQPQLSGIELFLGGSFEPGFGPLLMCGLGGIFLEVLKDVQVGLAPLSHNEAKSMISSLRSYPIIKGIRGKEGADEELFADILVRLSVLLENAPEIKEIDLNPLIGKGKNIRVVDARIRIER